MWRSIVKSGILAVCLFALALSSIGCGGGGPKTYTVSGTVTDGAAGPGLAEVTLSFSGDYGTATTGADGTWSKSGLSGTVTVTPAREGYTFAPPSRDVAGAASDVNFIATANPPSSYEVSGYVKDDKDAGISGVKISFSGGFLSAETGDGGYCPNQASPGQTQSPHMIPPIPFLPPPGMSPAPPATSTSPLRGFPRPLTQSRAM